MTKILIFDSGVGGLTVFDPIRKARPDADLLYVADNAVFPYGELPEADLLARVQKIFDHLIPREKPDLAVIACNTASTLVLPMLRERFSIPFVGTVPAIKPAAEQSRSQIVGVLATSGTAKRDYTAALIRDFASHCEIVLHAPSGLAAKAEALLHGESVPDEAIRADIAPCFVERNGKRTDVVVLACTHYPLLIDEMNRVAPWHVTFVDPAPAIARRVVQLIGERPATSPDAVDHRAIFTSERGLSATFHKTLSGYGIGKTSIEAI
jgi:glutamate racemase